MQVIAVHAAPALCMQVIAVHAAPALCMQVIAVHAAPALCMQVINSSHYYSLLLRHYSLSCAAALSPSRAFRVSLRHLSRVDAAHEHLQPVGNAHRLPHAAPACQGEAPCRPPPVCRPTTACVLLGGRYILCAVRPRYILCAVRPRYILCAVRPRYILCAVHARVSSARMQPVPPEMPCRFSQEPVPQPGPMTRLGLARPAARPAPAGPVACAGWAYGLRRLGLRLGMWQETRISS
jgi:hypothetical protein